MALVATTSHRELERVSQLAWEGMDYRVSLAYMTTEGFDAESDAADWDTVELSGNGYTAATGTIAAGAYDSGADARYELPVINAVFTASTSGSGLFATHYYMVLSSGGTDNANIVQLGTFSPELIWSPGQSQTIQIQLIVDD